MSHAFPQMNYYRNILIGLMVLTVLLGLYLTFTTGRIREYECSFEALDCGWKMTGFNFLKGGMVLAASGMVAGMLYLLLDLINYAGYLEAALEKQGVSLREAQNETADMQAQFNEAIADLRREISDLREPASPAG